MEDTAVERRTRAKRVWVCFMVGDKIDWLERPGLAKRGTQRAFNANEHVIDAFSSLKLSPAV
jgi:hypothetical protein